MDKDKRAIVELYLYTKLLDINLPDNISEESVILTKIEMDIYAITSYAFNKLILTTLSKEFVDFLLLNKNLLRNTSNFEYIGLIESIGFSSSMDKEYYLKEHKDKILNALFLIILVIFNNDLIKDLDGLINDL